MVESGRRWEVRGHWGRGGGPWREGAGPWCRRPQSWQVLVWSEAGTGSQF